MEKSTKKDIYYEPRVEIRPDLAIIETFQDGSQLIRKQGHIIIIESSKACLSRFKLYANLKLFSLN
ncbi:MAG: hypothetical protein CVU09_12810 [Bacteroidetes bacterium HGW-Bacteroidetes-4]|jgi:hypothetical protein|nr:MAG: hypothetical protein CVU09_12810 [Bacteroidetes bacterium HGW-Bacteroidetes-4]